MLIAEYKTDKLPSDYTIKGGTMPKTKGTEQTADTTPETAGSAETTMTDDVLPQTSGGEGEHQTEASEAAPTSMAEAIERAFEAAPKSEALTGAADEKPASETDQDEALEGETGDEAPADDGKVADAEADQGTEPDEEGEEADSTETSDDDPTEEEISQMGRKARNRISKLLSQRKEARDTAELHREGAENYKAVRSYMEQNHLGDTEVAELFQVGADLKSGDPKRLQGFLDRVMPMVTMALEATGQAVPSDLREQVENGDLTAEAAQTVGRSRYGEQLATSRLQQSQEAAQRTQTVQTQSQIASAVQTWFAKTQATDPDIGAKSAAMRRVAQALVAEHGLPRSPDEAVSQAQRAYDEATAILRSAAPKKATRPAPNTSSAAAPRRTGVQPAPTSLADVINQALPG